MKKEIPILFSTPMVKAINVDIKRKTRRTKGLEWINITIGSDCFIYDGICNDDKNFHYFEQLVDGELSKSYKKIKCPYGKVGDLLWVRETTREASHYGIEYPFIQYADLSTNTHCKIIDDVQIIFSKWKPSIHMLKKHCRIYLEITDIKCERLKEISEEDAIAEGVEKTYNGYLNYSKHYPVLKALQKWDSAKMSFFSLWESINGVESSELNPWVWVITFKRVSKP